MFYFNNDGIHGSDPQHVVIEGDNADVLPLLPMSDAVDVIYIDPPYNTGNSEWGYNDTLTGYEDFIAKRIELSYPLLKDSGVIMVSIGPQEHHTIRVILDRYFGKNNFIGEVVWQGTGSQLHRGLSGGLDYIIFYAKDKEKHFTSRGRWQEKKEGVAEAVWLVRSFKDSGATPKQAQVALRQFLKSSNVDSAVKSYNHVLDDWRIVSYAKTSNTRNRPNLKYDVTDPETGEVISPPVNGYVCSKQKLDTWFATGKAVIRSGTVYKVLDLEDKTSMVPRSLVHAPRASATVMVSNILGKKNPFTYPKNIEVLAHWFDIIADSNAVFLDFFAGSGSTAHAVMELNKFDKGSRKSISITNNELGDHISKDLADLEDDDPLKDAAGIYCAITKPRIMSVILGKTPRNEAIKGSVGAPFHRDLNEGIDTSAAFFRLRRGDVGDVDDTTLTRFLEKW